MNHIKYLIVLIVFNLNINCSQNLSTNEHKYWENLSGSEQKILLKSEKNDSTALEYYGNAFRASDDDKTFHLLEVLTTGNEEILPFYFYLFNKIHNHANGALAEVMGDYSMLMIINNPVYVFSYFNEGKDGDNALDQYAGSIGIEFAMESNYPFDYQGYRAKLDSSLKEYDNLITIQNKFWKEVDKVMEYNTELDL